MGNQQRDACMCACVCDEIWQRDGRTDGDEIEKNEKKQKARRRKNTGMRHVLSVLQITDIQIAKVSHNHEQ